MRAMPIRVHSGSKGAGQLKAAFRKNWKNYLREALGLALFMVSACFFSAMLFSEKSSWYLAISSSTIRDVLMGIAMGSTALFIFYAPVTAPSGSHINPAVTLAFLRLDRMCRYDAMFFAIFQFLGATVAVYVMQWLIGSVLTEAPVNSAVTIPGKTGIWWALITELTISFITMTMVLFTSDNDKLKNHTRIFSGCLVCAWVIFAGPVSGFGMNPARSFGSALPANTWTAFWIYLFMPGAGMLLAAEFYLVTGKRMVRNRKLKLKARRKKETELLEPLEFLV